MQKRAEKERHDSKTKEKKNADQKEEELFEIEGRVI